MFALGPPAGTASRVCADVGCWLCEPLPGWLAVDGSPPAPALPLSLQHLATPCTAVCSDAKVSSSLIARLALERYMNIWTSPSSAQGCIVLFASEVLLRFLVPFPGWPWSAT